MSARTLLWKYRIKYLFLPRLWKLLIFLCDIAIIISILYLGAWLDSDVFKISELITAPSTPY